MKKPDSFVSRCVFALAFSIPGLFLGDVESTQTRQNATNRTPNIVVILADDLGWKDVGYQGTDFYETPRIDRLAREGKIFSAAYAPAGNCQPTRACLISGQYTPRHHVYAVGSTERGPKDKMRTLTIPNRSGIAPEELSIADMLRDAGYKTGIFGKWHLDGPEGCPPQQQGFDVVMDVPHNGQGVDQDPKGIYKITNAAGEFFEENRERPFFAYVAHHAIHSGLQFQQETLDKFQAKAPGSQHRSPQYAACLNDFDKSVGMLLDKLESLGLAENTLVIFTSDNGATPQSSQEPLRGNKGSYHEGGIREPFIARWPAKITAGSTCDVPVSFVDLFPTFAQLSQARVPAEKVVDGESLVPLFLNSGTLSRKSIFWHFPGYLNDAVIRGRDPIFRTRPVSVINKDHWKLYLYHEEWSLDGGRTQIDSNRAVELYNLREDIGERTDLAATNKAKRDELLDELSGWIKSTDAQLASKPNPNYDPDSKSSKKKERKGDGGVKKQNNQRK